MRCICAMSPRNQAQEVDRLYNQLESSSSRILKQEPALVH